jgi:hypothetical protein
MMPEKDDGLWVAGRKRADLILNRKVSDRADVSKFIADAWDLAVIFRDLDRRRELQGYCSHEHGASLITS